MAQASVVERFFRAMQAGATHAEQMMDLFAEDAVYLEPFSGSLLMHRGKSAIRKVFEDGWRHPLPEMKIVVERVDVRGETVIADWTCYSPAIPGGSGSGTNTFVLKNGLITRLETQFREKK